MSDQKPVFQHLPKDVVPTLYKINIQPDFKKLTFKGSESVNITVSLFNHLERLKYY